jgi:hypothetical protein
MCPQHIVFVEVVRIGDSPTRVIRWETQLVKVLKDRDDRVGMYDGCGRGEMILDDLAED